jgi:ureidoacrylate peracid hydrolase
MAMAQGTHGTLVEARPHPLPIDPRRTAVIVVDMQNDFGAEGGMFARAGIDISGIQAAVAPTARVLTAARHAGIPVVYLKMGFADDLSDAGGPEAPNRIRHLAAFGVGEAVLAPDGAESRILIRNTWNTDILPELIPQPSDRIVDKHRFSGFFETELDAILQEMGITSLVFTGCTTSVCVESTLRDAFFRDYQCLLLADCTAEPIGNALPRSNHEGTLLLVELLFGWVSDSTAFVQTLTELAITAAV